MVVLCVRRVGDLSEFSSDVNLIDVLRAESMQALSVLLIDISLVPRHNPHGQKRVTCGELRDQR